MTSQTETLLLNLTESYHIISHTASEYEELFRYSVKGAVWAATTVDLRIVEASILLTEQLAWRFGFSTTEGIILKGIEC